MRLTRKPFRYSQPEKLRDDDAIQSPDHPGLVLGPHNRSAHLGTGNRPFLKGIIMGITFSFSLGQKVHFPETKISGFVDSLMVDRNGVQFVSLRYVDSTKEIQYQWIQESDLEAV